MKKKIFIYLADKTSEIIAGRYMHPRFAHLHYPENGKSESEIQKFVANLAITENNLAIVTDSLFLIREIYLQKIPVHWFSFEFETGTGFVRDSENLDDIGNIAILDRDLRQSERYMNFEMGLK